MSNIPQISIITPVYNGLPYIKECIESVLAQDFQDWEMLISDDGSNDGTRAYLETIKDSRIQVFMQKKNLGIFGNLNFIFKKAKGATSQILCQDDYFIDGLGLSKIIDYWRINEEKVGFVRFNYDEPSPCRTIVLEKKIMPSIVLPEHATLLFFVFGNIPGNLSNISLKTGLVAEYGNFREDLPYAGDFEFWSRVANYVPMGTQKEMVTYVRRHAGVASNYLNRKGELLPQICKITNTLYQKLSIKYPDTKRLLRIQGTLNYDSLQRDVAIRQLIKTNWVYLNTLNDVANQSNYSFSNLIRWILYIISLGGRLGRDILAKYIVSNVLK